MALDILEEGVVGIWDFLLKVAIVSVPVLSLKLLHPTETAWLDLGQRLQRPSRTTLRHSEVINNVFIPFLMPLSQKHLGLVFPSFKIHSNTSSD